MIVGILSDSHGRHVVVKQAVELFDRLGVSVIIHCGDVGGIDVFEELTGRDLHFVWGNTDEPTDGVLSYLRTVSIAAPQSIPLEMELQGRRIHVFHGHETGFDAAIRGGDADYLLHGHTHQTRDERVGRMRIINPGALHRARPRTVATLDLESDRLEFHVIPAL